MLFAGSALVGGALAMLFPALAVVAVNAAHPSTRGAAAASFTAFFDSGFAAGGIVGGFIASQGSYADAFWVGAACALAATSVTAVLRRPRAPAADAALVD
jgi:predicted MFS family arabinose efflux permease